MEIIKRSSSDLSEYSLFQIKKLFWPCLKEGYADPPSKTQPSPPLRSGHNFMKDAECAEANENSYFRFFRFLFFELW